ncbi:MAG: mannose-1-phosphate guanylyltransferase [Gemmatimonadales bacterium]|nr:mannose-1-phosphate guanylyltransferase [Gemmatimonadales bacterium]
MDWAVILAGGSGTRFWPLSSPSRPKQLLPLVAEHSTAEDTLDRLTGFIPKSRILVVTGPALAPLLTAKLDLDPANVLIEPRAASTGPALVWATAEALKRDPSATILSLHADWAVGDRAAFARTAEAALLAARTHDRLVTVGIVPDRPETGYGYIIPGDQLDGGVRTVARFAEKPDLKTATALVASGALWNSGLFAWTARRLMDEISAHAPEIGAHTARLAEGDVAGFFAGVAAISIDVGLLERSERVVVLSGAFGWDDIGTWEALTRVRKTDAAGNVMVGAGVAFESSGCIAWSEGTPIVLSGVKDLVVVHANGRILVMDRSRAADLKRVLDALPAPIRDLPG